ncbi:hypothetical protein [Sulfitobacter pontiacus]|uniref:hypothetical protein n=1 Tax=Sulfitobacter pontiacus TaxID=60137 RepID=UPI0030EB4A12
MDQKILVKQAQALTESLDGTKLVPKAVMLVISQETGNWRLWIVPSEDKIDKQEFYRIVAETISEKGISDIDVGSVEFAKSDNPAMRGMGKMIHAPGIGNAYMSNNTFNGILLPDGFVIRMAL